MQPYLEHFDRFINIHDPRSPGQYCHMLTKDARIDQLREAVAIIRDRMQPDAEYEAARRAAVIDFAARHGCPPDVAVYPWLLKGGLVDADGIIAWKPELTSQARRDSLVAKIRALHAMTACAEAEAMAAAELAARLMSTWECEEADLAEAERGLEIEGPYIVKRPKVDLCLAQLQKLTRCKVDYDDGECYKVVGDRPEIEFFSCLYYIIADAMWREYSAYAEAHAGRLDADAKSSFQIEMANRINLRLAQLGRERDAAMQAGGDPGRAGRALALVEEKQAAIEAFTRSKVRIGG